MAIPFRRDPTYQAPAGPAPLGLVPARRRVARFMVALTVLLGAVMIGAVLLHTRLAARQLDIDSLERSVRQEQEQFDELRAQRAELRSPSRLALEADRLGMVPGSESDFIHVDPMVLAITIARTGEMPVGDEFVDGSSARMRPLDQFRAVKTLSSERP
jgi:hypothetical protein